MKNKYLLLAIAAVVLVLALSALPARADCDPSGIQNGVNCAGQASGLAKGGLTSYITNIINVMLAAVGIISVIMIIIGGIRYALSGGDESNTRAAKDTILYAVIGLAVAILAFVIVNFVLGIFF
jgi:hypothetical protein